MKYRTKQSRQIALGKAWQQLYGQSGFTPAKVDEWATANGLYPLPLRTQGPTACQAWEDRLDQVIKAAREIKDEAGRPTAGPAAGQDVTGGSPADARRARPDEEAEGPGPGPGVADPDGSGGQDDQGES